MLTTATLNVVIDRVAYRPLRRSPRLAPLITAIGVSFMLENIALLWKGPAPIAYPDVFPSVDILREWFGIDSAIFFTTKDVLVVAVTTIPLMIGLHYFVTRTRWGKAMRATAQDRETAAAMGINVERIDPRHVLRGRGAGRRGRADPGHVLQHRHVVDGLPGGTARLHRRGARRHRQHGRAPRSAASPSASCRRGATSTSRRAGPTPSSSRSSSSSSCSAPTACWASGLPTRRERVTPAAAARSAGPRWWRAWSSTRSSIAPSACTPSTPCPTG